MIVAACIVVAIGLAAGALFLGYTDDDYYDYDDPYDYR